MQANDHHPKELGSGKYDDTISILRARGDQKVQDLSSIWQRKVTSHLDDQLRRLPRSARTLQDLKQELEITDAGEQLFRLRKYIRISFCATSHVMLIKLQWLQIQLCHLQKGL